MIKLFKLRHRIAAFLLAMIMLFTYLPVYAFSLDSDIPSSEGAEKEEAGQELSKVMVLHNGAEKPLIELKEDGKEIITSFETGIEPTDRSWQILIPGESKWVDIYGCHSSTLAVSYAMVGSMLDSFDTAYIRSKVNVGEDVYTSASVGIRILYNVDEEAVPQKNKPVMAKPKRASSDVPELQTYTLVINYIFDSGEIAFEPFGATIAGGSSFYRVIESPTIVGYEPYRRFDGDYVIAKEVVIDIESVTEDVTINVIYEPTIVDFKVHHHLQDVSDDKYSDDPDFITSHQALTGSIVGDGLALTKNELPGFYALAYERLEVAADGSTVIEIRYDRNYYLVNFDMQGGYGVEPLYVRYGTPVGVNSPIRHGYLFDGWQLVSFGGEAPSAQESSVYDINGRTITVPDANITYRAKWITQLTEYTMVFWKENIEDNGFTYWGFLDGIGAMSGTEVDGADRISEVGGIDDENCFTYNDALTDKDVIVEGDGSTVVNVYYTRNRYSITFKAKGLCTIEPNHVHSDECYDLLCNKAHLHTDDCHSTLSCTQPEHTSHSDDCLICGKEYHVHSSACCGLEEHSHSKSCFYGVGNQSTPSGAPTGVEEGYIHAVRSGFRYTYYIYIDGTWYRYTGGGASSGDVVDPTCSKTSHTHGSSDCSCKKEVHEHDGYCFSDTLHTHSEGCYSYSCNAVQHVHSDGCYILDCSMPTGHSHSNNCLKASSTNTVKISHYKYQANLESEWPVTDDNGVVYNSGQRWEPSEDSDTYSAVLVYIANMPGENLTLTLNESKNDTYTMYYYLEVLEGESYDVTYNGKYFKYYTEIKANYNYITEAEDFFNINGFYKFGSNPAFKSGQIDINGGGEVKFYYGRIVDHHLQFQSNGIILNTHTVSGVPYGASLGEYNFVPEYPESLEPGAFVFGGWYTSPGHYKGTEVDWDTLTMDAGDVLLYAKWTPITHTVEVYFDNTYETLVGSPETVTHGSFATAPTASIENGGFIFQGWFYSETVDGVVIEKAFVFTGIPVVKDLKIYAKWSSHVNVSYRIEYVLDSTGEAIADPTVGESMAGHNKTFYAKAGKDLYEGFTEGYYPLTSSHTIVMNPKDGDNLTFRFRYVYVESMPYLVRYVDEDGNKVSEDKRVTDNNLSVVTETFVRVENMMPDAYQKRLVLSADKTDEDNDQIYDDNVITFIYTEDYEHAYYKIIYYVEHIETEGYREFRSEESVGVINEVYEFSLINLTGFSYNPGLTKINGVYAPTEDGKVKATLGEDGLLVELYYDREDVNYTVRYLDYDTELPIYEDKRGKGIFGEQVVETALGLTSIGYVLVGGASVKSLVLSSNSESNVIEFYYQENSVSLKYQIVGPAGAGALSYMSENVKAVSGIPVGSRPIVSAGYHFVGWFLDENCHYPVPGEWVNSENYEIIPERRDEVWLTGYTYYAKIDPDFTTLVINTIGCTDVDAGQIFIFNVKGTSALSLHVEFTVTVVGNGSVTIKELPIGNYTVTELTAWSYRYTPDSVEKSIELSVDAAYNKLTFSHLRSNNKWLDGNANNINNFN